MTDLSLTVAPKSDQLNADDLITGPRTIRVTKVSANESNADQPINIYFDGDNGKPYRPCKSMRRVLITVWGKDGAAYAGRSMTIYRDAKVAFGGMEVGGIRISHMTNIDKPVTMALTATKASRKPFRVEPLVVTGPEPDFQLLDTARRTAAQGTEAFRAWWKGLTGDAKAQLAGNTDDLKRRASEADSILGGGELLGLPDPTPTPEELARATAAAKAAADAAAAEAT